MIQENISPGSPSGTVTYDSAPGYPDKSGFDKVGNRRSRTSSGSIATPVPSTSYSYNSNDRITTESYDSNGNTSIGAVYPAQTQNDEYDFENRLVKRYTTINSQTTTVILK